MADDIRVSWNMMEEDIAILKHYGVNVIDAANERLREMVVAARTSLVSTALAQFHQGMHLRGTTTDVLENYLARVLGREPMTPYYVTKTEAGLYVHPEFGARPFLRAPRNGRVRFNLENASMANSAFMVDDSSAFSSGTPGCCVGEGFVEIRLSNESSNVVAYGDATQNDAGSVIFAEPAIIPSPFDYYITRHLSCHDSPGSQASLRVDGVPTISLTLTPESTTAFRISDRSLTDGLEVGLVNDTVTYDVGWDIVDAWFVESSNVDNDTIIETSNMVTTSNAFQVPIYYSAEGLMTSNADPGSMDARLMLQLTSAQAGHVLRLVSANTTLVSIRVSAMPAPEAAPEPAPEAAPEAAPEPAPEAAPEPAPEAAPEAAPEPAPEA